jgi:porphobilinogen deaminase
MTKYKVSISHPFLTPDIEGLFQLDGEWQQELVFLQKENDKLEYADLVISEYNDVEIDAILAPLDLVPIEMEAGWVIAALLERKNPASVLVLPADKEGKTSWPLKNGDRVGTYTSLQLSQLEDLIPGVDACLAPLSNDFISDIANWDGRIVPGYYYQKIHNLLPRHKFIHLNPVEFCPPTGSGVFALICKKEDVSLRKLLASFHHKASAELTNMERSVVKSINVKRDMTIVSHVYCDAYHYYHLMAEGMDEDGKILKVSASLSTKAELVDHLVTELFNKLNA